MIIDIITENYKDVFATLFVAGICWAVVFFAVGLDLFHGLKKAKELGEVTTSEGLKRTIKKVAYYYTVMIFGAKADDSHFLYSSFGRVLFV